MRRSSGRIYFNLHRKLSKGSMLTFLGFCDNFFFFLSFLYVAFLLFFISNGGHLLDNDYLCFEFFGNSGLGGATWDGILSDIFPDMFLSCSDMFPLLSFQNEP